MAKAVVRAKGQLTIPTQIRRAAGLQDGDPVEVEITDAGILLRPQKVIDPDQAWFWTREWQAGEREASRDIAAGRVRTFYNTDEFLAYLEHRPKARARRKGTRPARPRR